MNRKSCLYFIGFLVFLNHRFPITLEAINISYTNRNKSCLQPGRLLALDLGARRVGLAVSDELRITVRPLPTLHRTNWKRFVRELVALCTRFDARGLILGLPLRLNGVEGDAAREAKRVAHNLELSLGIPVYLQDERLTTHDAIQNLRAAGVAEKLIPEQVDSEAAAIILRDFILSLAER